MIKDISFQNLYKKKSVQEFIAKSIDKKVLEIGDKHENELGVAIAPVYGNKTGIVTIISDDGDFETSKKLNELSKNYNVPKDCSPAAVYGYAREEGRMFKTHISVPTIYSYIKKGTDFSKVTPEEIAATESWINSYPRKILGYKSAGTEFRECLRKLGLTA